VVPEIVVLDKIAEVLKLAGISAYIAPEFEISADEVPCVAVTIEDSRALYDQENAYGDFTQELQLNVEVYFGDIERHIQDDTPRMNSQELTAQKRAQLEYVGAVRDLVSNAFSQTRLDGIEFGEVREINTRFESKPISDDRSVSMAVIEIKPSLTYTVEPIMEINELKTALGDMLVLACGQETNTLGGVWQRA